MIERPGRLPGPSTGVELKAALGIGPLPSRRQILTCLGGLAAAACTGKKGAEGPKPAVVPLARIPPGERVRVEVNGRPVELLRAVSGALTARSLLCTHQGCEVFWVEEQRAYFCPCHEGRFDPEGRVASGPPPAPLGTLRVELRGADALVGG